jgi:zeaxanthin glucosyltransferase
MARFAILTLPEAGHLYPMGAVGMALVERGHEVTVIARAKARPMVENFPLAFRELKVDHVPWPSDSFFIWAAFRAFGAGGLVSFRDSFTWDAEGVLQQVPSLLKELAIDGVVVDHVTAAGGTAAERAGLPFATICTAPPYNEDPLHPPPFTPWQYENTRLARLRNRLGYAGWRWFIRPTLRVLNRYRRAWGLRRLKCIDDSYSSLAQISQLFPELDFPRSAMPSCFHYVGALAADRQYSADAFPWDRLDGRPLIFASLGTIDESRNRPVYSRIAAACEGLPAQLVISRGKWAEEGEGSWAAADFPGNPLVVDFAPQLALLDRAAVLITHCGLNTVLEAISRGVPMVAMPRNADQPGNAVRVVRAGAGLSASFNRSAPRELREIIRRVLCEEKFRQRAGELRQELLRGGAARRAAEIVEEALLSRRLVDRGLGVTVQGSGKAPILLNPESLPLNPACLS